MLWISDKMQWSEEDGPLEEWEGKNGRYRMMMSVIRLASNLISCALIKELTGI
jgi:hypothetical protein